MVAPRAETIFAGIRGGGRRIAGITLACPTCTVGWRPLRVETAADYPPGKAPELAGNAGPLGFIARCDACGFRVELHGDRLPTVAMMKEATS